MSGARADRLTEAQAVGRHIHDFCWDWAPTHLTRSEHTLRSYRTSLRLYVEWLSSTEVTPTTLSASDFSAAKIEGWLGWLSSERGNAPQTCNNRLSAIKCFLAYVSAHDPTMAHLEAGASSVTNRSAPRAKVEGLTREAVGAVIRAPGSSTRQGIRDTTIMVVLYATACRIGELLSLRMSQLHLDAGSPYVQLVGKGGKARVAYLPAKAVRHLRSYIAEFHGVTPDPDAYLFWSRNHPAGTHRLSQDAVAKMLRKHATTASAECPDVPVGLTAHRFRHARASHWLEDGMSVAQVSHLLGHANIQTTMLYLDITVDAQSEAMQKMSGAPEPEGKRWHGAKSASLLSMCGFAP